MSHHFIFEGAELAGKSWIMSQVYNYLEPKNNSNQGILDGCHWFNCDVGVFGSVYGRSVIGHYLGIFKELKDKNILAEKLHISDIVYNRGHRGVELDYAAEEEALLKMGFKIVLITFPEDEALIRRRITDRLKLYPHYERIMHDPGWYINQQKEYFKEITKSRLPHLIIETDKLPDDGLAKKILTWIGEK